MTDYAYLPSVTGWPFLLGERVILGVDVPLDSPRLVALWSIVAAGKASAEVLDELTRGGISQTPSFALVESRRASGVRVVVRGDVEVIVTSGVGEARISGAGVSSWTEQLIERVTRVELIAGAVETDAALPVAGGVVVAARIIRSGDAVPLFGEVHRAETPEPELVVAARPKSARQVAAAHAVDVPAVAAPDADVPSETTLVGVTVSEAPFDDEPLLTPALSSAEPAGGYDHLFGETVMREVEDAAVRESDDAAGLEEHTVVATNLSELRAQRRAARKTEPEAPAVQLYLELSTGGRELLDRPIVVGRAPSATRSSGRSVPRLVTMTTPNQDISRTHAQISYEGGSVVVTDLHSKNGTMITLPGKPPQKLREGEPVVVIVGTVIDLGDGATLTVREEG